MKKIKSIRLTLPLLALFAAIALTAFTPHARHKATKKFSGAYYYGQVSGSTTAYVGEVITVGGSQWHDYTNDVNDSYYGGSGAAFANAYCDTYWSVTCVVAGTAADANYHATVDTVFQGAWGL